MNGQMSNKQILKMKYHPAKKKVIFELFRNQKKIEIPDTSRLAQYMNIRKDRGGFVLQDQGKEFLNDIANVFDGLQEAWIEVVTTKDDYNDFAEMVDIYNNENPDVKIETKCVAELPDMDMVYQHVSEYGEKSKTILKDYLAELKGLPVPDDADAVKKAVKSLLDDGQKKLDEIECKVSAMEKDDNVKLCFAGVFSSGKSSLINAILGFPILPMDIRPKTEKMFSIQSPKSGEEARIECKICNKPMNIIWNGHSFTIDTIVFENGTRKKLQTKLNENAGRAQHEQMNILLDCLNSAEDVSEQIDIFFPVPLDDDKVHFTIYDTPGTDSGNPEHQAVLMDALSSQTHSILIFVATPDTLEGSGNRALMQYLKRAQKTSVTSIDIGRSLFVINKADSEENLESLKGGKLVLNETDADEDEKFEIDLSDKKLFFVSAKYANIGASVKNDFATQKQKDKLARQEETILDESEGMFFLQDQCAKSQYGTNRIHRESEEALNKARADRNVAEIFHVASGLYALEKEITTYGRKFAAAVRTCAIIENVEEAFTSIDNQAKILNDSKQATIEKMEKEIETAKRVMNDAIVTASEKFFPKAKDGGILPEEDKIRLHLSPDWIKKDITESAETAICERIINHKIKWGRDEYINKWPKDRKRACDVLNNVLDQFRRTFIENRTNLLMEKREGFIKAVKKAFRENGGLCEDAQEVILNIKKPGISNAKLIQPRQIDNVFDNAATDKILWWERVQKDDLLNGLSKTLLDVVEDFADSCIKDFSDERARISGEMVDAFLHSLEEYSVLLKGLIKNSIEMREIGKTIQEVANKIEVCTTELEGVIWEEKKDAD